MKNFLMTAVPALLLLWLISGCATYGSKESRIVTGGDFVLKSGESLNGDMLVLGGNSTLEKDSHLSGNLNVIGGNTDANGEINGSVWLMGGNVDLGPNAVVRGDATINGGNLSRAPGAQITGNVNSGMVFGGPMNIPVLTITPAFLIGWFLVRSLLLAVLAAVIVLIAPEPVKRTADAIVRQPVGAALVGLVAMLIAPVLLVLFAITVIGIPLTLLGVVVLLAAMLLGWTALGVELAKRLDAALKLNWAPAAHALVGTLVLAIVLSALELIPIVGWLPSIIASMFALGGVVLTRFGTRGYAPPSNVMTPPPVAQSPAS